MRVGEFFLSCRIMKNIIQPITGTFCLSVSVRGNKAEPGVNTLHVHTVPGTVSDKLG